MAVISEPIHISDSNFQKFALESKLPVVVDFWAAWCAPCKRMTPIIDALAKKYAGKVMFYKVDADANQEWVKNYDISGLPTLLFINHGEVADRIAGLAVQAIVEEKIEAMLA